MKKLIRAEQVRPGQDFSHFGQDYRRATDEEERRHPCRGFAKDRPLVFGYQGTMPVTFVPQEGVVVEVNKRPYKGGSK